MPVNRVWVGCEPYIYRDVLTRLLGSLEQVAVAPRLAPEVDVMVFSADEADQPPSTWLPAFAAQIKLIALPPHGPGAWLRLPGETGWQVIQPFDLQALFAEVRAGRRRPAASDSPPSFKPRPRVNQPH